MEGFRKLRAGQRVTFVPDEDEHGRAMAREVTVISEEE
jgi:cold shock CspA family protein